MEGVNLFRQINFYDESGKQRGSVTVAGPLCLPIATYNIYLKYFCEVKYDKTFL